MIPRRLVACLLVALTLGAFAVQTVGASAAYGQSAWAPSDEQLRLWGYTDEEIVNMRSDMAMMSGEHSVPTSHKYAGQMTGGSVTPTQNARQVFTRGLRSKAPKVLRTMGRAAGPISWVITIGMAVQALRAGENPLKIEWSQGIWAENGDGPRSTVWSETQWREGGQYGKAPYATITNLRPTGFDYKCVRPADWTSGTYGYVGRANVYDAQGSPVTGSWTSGGGTGSATKIYCNPYGGSGSVTFSKPAPGGEVWISDYTNHLQTPLPEDYGLLGTIPDAPVEYPGNENVNVVDADQPGQQTEVQPTAPLTADPPAPGDEYTLNYQQSRELYDYIRAQPEYDPWKDSATERDSAYGPIVEQWRNPDGSITTRYQDGTIITVWPDGKKHIRYTDQSQEWIGADGRPIQDPYQFPNPLSEPNNYVTPQPEPTPTPSAEAEPIPTPDPNPTPVPPTEPPSTTPGDAGADPACGCDPRGLIQPNMHYEEKFPFSLIVYITGVVQAMNAAAQTAPSWELPFFGVISMGDWDGAVSRIRMFELVVGSCGICFVMYQVITRK